MTWITWALIAFAVLALIFWIWDGCKVFPDLDPARVQWINDELRRLAEGRPPGCSSCRFARAVSGYSTFECRRHAPLTVPVEHWRDAREATTWPTMRGDDWCGDHEDKPEGAR